MKNYLIVGMSHTVCLQRALQNEPNPHFAVVNVRKTKIQAKGYEWPLKPNVVCLSIEGNAHNIIALLEHPTPYSVGGILLDDGKDRIPIARNMLRDFMYSRLAIVGNYIKQMHSKFENVSFMHIAAPPPIGAMVHVTHYPEVFKAKLHLGLAPDELRLAVYGIQIDFHAQLAAELGALFLLPPSITLDSSGMLGKEYSGGDPTHGNARYGREVLDQIIQYGEK